jgi:GDP-4-dehydro-6-deoxy-D-mannose reductase
MKKILLIGIDGFAAKHLIERILQQEKKGYDITATYLEEQNYQFPKNVRLYKLDITEAESVRSFFKNNKFDNIYHLAGISSVGLSWKRPSDTLSVNTIGTVNVLDSIKEYGKDIKFLYVSSVEVYGSCYIKKVNENDRPNPENPYSISKLASEYYVRMYGKVFGLNVFIARPVIHTGPGQTHQFAVIDFCQQALKIKKCKYGQPPSLTAGNIDVMKDYCDVRDVADAYILMMRKAKSGEIYNISSGKRITLRRIINTITTVLSIRCDIILDKTRMRPYDPDMIKIDSGKIRSLGWNPSYSMKETIEDILKQL